MLEKKKIFLSSEKKRSDKNQVGCGGVILSRVGEASPLPEQHYFALNKNLIFPYTITLLYALYRNRYLFQRNKIKKSIFRRKIETRGWVL